MSGNENLKYKKKRINGLMKIKIDIRYNFSEKVML